MNSLEDTKFIIFSLTSSLNVSYVCDSSKIIFIGLFIFFLTLLLFPKIVFGKNLIRDAEIEETLRIITAPLLENTKIDKESFKVLVVNDSSMNAFVTSGQYIFIHYGLITKLETVEQLQSVIAHEVAHVIGGHYIKRMTDIESAKTVAGIGMALSAAAGLAAGDTNLVIGLAAGTQSASKRAFLKNTRTQEASADQTGIKLIATDSSHNVLIHMKLLSENFDYYKCKGDHIIGVNMTNMYKLIKTMNNSEGGSQKLLPSDFYIENGIYVFTKEFHLRRGSCCGNGCRHCPFFPAHKKGNTTIFIDNG